MLRVSDTPGGLLTITVGGRLTRSDYEGIRPALDRWVAEHGTLQGVVDFEDFVGWEPAAAWEDLKAGIHYAGSWGRFALVSDKPWHPRLVRFLSALFPGEYRSFGRNQQAVARQWAATGIEPSEAA